MRTPFGFGLLHLFTVGGKTFTFRDGVLTVDNETTLVFEYSASSDGRKKTGVFQKSNLAGYSVGEVFEVFNPTGMATGGLGGWSLPPREPTGPISPQAKEFRG